MLALYRKNIIYFLFHYRNKNFYTRRAGTASADGTAPAVLHKFSVNYLDFDIITDKNIFKFI